MTETGTQTADGDRTIAELTDVTRTYGGIPVVDSVSLSIRPGVTAVIGPNGSGKSTLLGLLAGTVEPVEGVVDRVGPGDEHGERRVGYLPQDVPFRESFTARETLAFYARFVDADPDAHIASVGLTDAVDRRVNALSGGMRRLLGIAQATIGDPPLVVLDEPTSGLDPGMRVRAFRLAAAAADGHTAVVVSSHDLDPVGEHADRLVLLDRGTIAAAGGVDSLFEAHDVSSVAGLYRSVVGSEPGGEGGSDDTDPAVHVTGVSE